MSINGISAGYYPAGYVNNKITKTKANAPNEVRHACKEVKVETNGIVTVYRLCISNGQEQCYITKMMVDRFARWSNDEKSIKISQQTDDSLFRDNSGGILLWIYRQFS